LISTPSVAGVDAAAPTAARREVGRDFQSVLAIRAKPIGDFHNKIGPKQISRHTRYSVAIGVKADIEQASPSASSIYE